MAKPSAAQRRDDRKYGVSRRGGAEADSFENELGESAAVTDVGHRSRFRAGVAEAAALGKISRGDAMNAFSRFDELTTTGTYSNKARPSATSFSRQPAAGGLRENWAAQMRWHVNSFTNNASQESSQVWWDKSRKTFGHTGEGGARNIDPGFYDPFGVNRQLVPDAAAQAQVKRVDSPLTNFLDLGGDGDVQAGDPFMAEEDGYNMLALGTQFGAGNDMLTRTASDAFAALSIPYEEKMPRRTGGSVG